MDFAFSEEQEELRRYVRQWLVEKSDSKTVRELMATDEGYSVDQWADIAQMGWQSMAIPEEYGGAGFGFLELAVLLEEQGRVLFVSPFFSTTVLAAQALLIAGSSRQKKEFLPGIAAGTIVATVAASDSDGHLTSQGTKTTATRNESGWVLDGNKRFVVDGQAAGYLIVTANTGDRVDAFIVDSGHVNRSVMPTLDETRKLAEIELDGVSVSENHRLPGDAGEMLAQLDRIAAAALSVESVGAAQACLDMSVDYAKDRTQFGRPIGSFQAIKHKCADMLVQVEAAKAAAYYAAWAVSENAPDLPNAASVAKAYCTDAFFHCASENIQIHGGIGFTWEHDAHLYFKRAKSSQLIFGSPQHHRRQLATAIDL